MAHNMIPWDQTPEFLAATDTTIVSGGLTTYPIPRQRGNSAQDVTAFHPGHVSWSKYMMPDIMYQLNPTEAWSVFTTRPLPPQRLSPCGKLVYVASDGSMVLSKNANLGRDYQRLLDFKILPDKIGTCEEWWFFEAVRRLDPRLRWEDILMRMEPLNRPTGNALQERLCRTWRPAFHMLAWHTIGRFAKGNAKHNAVIELLNQDQLDRNTTRGCTPGLKNPNLGEAGGRIFLPEMKLGAGLSRIQATRLREEQKLQKLQDTVTGGASGKPKRDHSESIKQLETPQDFANNPKELASRAEQFSPNNVAGMPLPSVQNTNMLTKRYCSRRRFTSSRSTGAPRVRDYATADSDDQNAFDDSNIFNSSVHTPSLKRQHENEIEGIKQEDEVIAKRPRTAIGLSPNAHTVASGVMLQPSGTASGVPWKPEFRSHSNLRQSSSTFGLYPPGVQLPALNCFPAYSAPTPSMVITPATLDEIGRSQTRCMTDCAVSLGPANILANSSFSHHYGEDVLYGNNHFEVFHRTQEYQWLGEDSPVIGQMHSFVSPTMENYGQTVTLGPSQQEPFAVQDSWTLYPPINYDLLAQQGWDDLYGVIRARYGPHISLEAALNT